MNRIVDAPTRISEIAENRMQKCIRVPVGGNLEALFLCDSVRTKHIIQQRLGVRFPIRHPYALRFPYRQRLKKLNVAEFLDGVLQFTRNLNACSLCVRTKFTSRDLRLGGQRSPCRNHLLPAVHGTSTDTVGVIRAAI